jgi:hypothetical protein
MSSASAFKAFAERRQPDFTKSASLAPAAALVRRFAAGDQRVAEMG